MVMAARGSARCRPSWEPLAGSRLGLAAVQYSGACSTELSAGLQGYLMLRLCLLEDLLWLLAGFRDRVAADLYFLAFSRESPARFRGQLAAALGPVV